VPVSMLAAGDLAYHSSLSSEREGSDGPWVRRIPNPLRVGAQIQWSGRGEPITIGVYDVSGRLLRVIEDSATDDGLRVRWDGRASDGEAMRTGLYLFRIRQGESVWGRRVLVLR